MNLIGVKQKKVCPSCKSKKCSSHGVAWICTECGRSWSKFKRPVKGIQDPSRPLCPRCKGPNPISHGSQWMCQKCGKTYSKYDKNPRIFFRDDDIRPDCPACGKSQPIKNGVSWRCKGCGRTWTKINRLEMLAEEKEKLNTDVNLNMNLIHEI